MASADMSWMPAQGRHSVSVGTSLARALKARKGATSTKRSALPERDFYSFRYNFKPESIDPTKPGFIDVRRTKESGSVTVERCSTQAGEYHLFVGNEQPAKEWECVLIYDDETGTFTLEKLDSFMTLNHGKKTNVSSFNRASATGSPAPAPSVPSTPAQPLSDLDLDLEAELEREIADVGAQIGDDVDEGDAVEEFETGLHVPSRPKSTKRQSTRSRARSPDVPLAKERSLQSQGRTLPNKKDYHDDVATALDVEEEELSFGQPTRPAVKRPRLQHLAEDSSSSRSLPASDSHHTSFLELPTKGASGLSSSFVGVDSDSEEDWDGFEGDALEAEINRQLASDDGDAHVTAEPVAPPLGQPMSLNQFASGRAVEANQYDSYTSSEESEVD